MRNWRKGLISALMALGVGLGFVVSLGVTLTMLWASIWNYPGGHALSALHTHKNYSNYFQSPHCHNITHITVHIGTLPAMTGISRFAELSPCWTYSKVRTPTSPTCSDSVF